jgi:hypothetical protein
MDIVKRFFEYTFIRRSEDISAVGAPQIVIDEVPEPSAGGSAVKPKRSKPYPDPELRARIDIAIHCNRVIGAVLLLTVGFMLIYSYTSPEKAIPTAISRIAWSCLGYFGSAMAVFLGRNKRKP